MPVGGLLGVCECVHGALRCTGVPSSMYSRFAPNVPGIGSGPTTTLTVKWLLKMN
ncbi:hypothetical protein PGIGA_G00156280 [Pangasianodon gigas]|uniref:Uncharacterized protein n=1 Tax=Pangasianodon gigas TaxID=30993 RepID=A0ACC5XQ24_PANGG|nr:hypothetical protein [Pangasianodon gigas]